MLFKRSQVHSVPVLIPVNPQQETDNCTETSCERNNFKKQRKDPLDTFWTHDVFQLSFFLRTEEKELFELFLRISFWTSLIVVKQLLCITQRPFDLWKIFVWLFSLHIYEIRAIPYICFNQKAVDN